RFASLIIVGCTASSRQSRRPLFVYGFKCCDLGFALEEYQFFAVAPEIVGRLKHDLELFLALKLRAAFHRPDDTHEPDAVAARLVMTANAVTARKTLKCVHFVERYVKWGFGFVLNRFTIHLDKFPFN